MIIPIKEDIALYCQTVLQNPSKYCIIDTETTGFEGEIIDLSIIDPDGNVLYNSLLKPRCSIEKSAQDVHHIDKTMLVDAPTFRDEWAKINNALQGRIVVVYNADFDHGRFVYTAKLYGVSLPDSTWQCLMRKYATYYDAPPKPNKTNAPFQKLPLACAQQGLDIGVQEHRALSDTLATLALIKRIAELGPATRQYSEASKPWPSMVSLDEMLSLQRPQGQDMALKLIDASQSIDEIAPSVSPFSANLVDFNVCCKCDKKASLMSLSGGPQSAYCDEHGKSRCGQHTIADFVFCNIRKAWLCPCIANKAVLEKPQQQSLLLVS